MGEPTSNPGMRRTAKDSVFCDLFSQKRYALDLYRSVHPEDDAATADDIEIVTLERVVTSGEYNDVGFIVSGRLLVLVEAQTDWSTNIVVRMLLYLAETLRRDLSRRGVSLHRTAPVEVPTPELYVVYTGGRDVPDAISFRCDVPGGEGSFVDAVVRILRGGENDIVGQYVAFAGLVGEVRADQSVPVWDKAREVVQRCIGRGILEAYMEERRVEAEGIMFTLFDQERETEIYHRELKEQLKEEVTEEVTAQVTAQVTEEVTAQARAADAAQIAKSLGLSIDQALDALAIPEEDREKIAGLVMAS